MKERKIDKMKEFLAEKVDHHVFKMEENGQFLARKIEHRSKAEAFKEALDELEGQMTIAEEEPETVTVQVKSLKDERTKPEVPEVVAEFIEKMRDYYITPRFYEKPENEAAVLAYYATRFLFDDGRKSDKTIVLMNKMNEWLLDRNNFFVLIDAIRRGYVVKKEYYYIRLTEEASKAFSNNNENVRYLKVSNEEEHWYFGSVDLEAVNYEKRFNEQEKDMWLDKLKAIPLEAVRVDEVE